ncbi:hypothetical protein [Pseudoprimorskyibacter insulae]|uniref:DUF3887 domain-containing protein n=1 Tax=Pseudoprimorskyibacter insulae TaxID=1695997 RepID=A0A2R8AZ24_9RHOB|nr:hypothetical protein [Pseudoprimorskyibacter insulae]SPF81288.1 hypothetical protein PRI8871_03110 [Pseudoprimorskyibacter insulae]
MRRILIAAAVALLPVASFAQDAVFDSYDALYKRMVDLTSSRNIAKLMIEFGGSDEMTQQQLDSLEARVRQIYPNDFQTVQRVRVQEFENGWRQEMFAFYTGVDYLYTYLLIHDRGDRVAAVNFKFNSAFDKVNEAF